jgi:hypothetical protein
MSDPARSAVWRGAAFGVGLLALLTAGYGIYLLIVGVTVVSMPEVPEGTPPGPTSTVTLPRVEGLIPTVAGGLILVGLALRRIWLAWAGALLASLFAALFVFSIGGILLPVAAALLVLLGIVTWTGVTRIGRSSTALRS